MNMISTGAFLPEMDASNKQETMAEKFARVWEKKNSKVARAGGVSLMALSLAACGSSSDDTATTTPAEPATPAEPTTPVVTAVELDLTAARNILTANDFTTANDTVAATGATLTGTDVIAEGTSTDSDTLTVSLAEGVAGTAPASVTGIENVVYNVAAFTTPAIDVDNIIGAEITVNNTQVGGQAAANVDNLSGTSNVTFGSGVTGTADVTLAEGSDSTVNAGVAAQLDVADAGEEGATIVAGDDTNTIEVEGDGDTNAAGTANDAVSISGAGAVALDTNDAAGGGTDQVENITLSGNGAAVTYTLDAGDAPETIAITGSQNVTLVANAADLDTETVTNTSTGTATVQINDDATANLDLIATSVMIDVADTATGGTTLTVANNANVTVSAAGVISFDSDELTTGDETINLTVNIDGTGSAIGVSDFEVINVATATPTAGVGADAMLDAEIVGGATSTINLTGAVDLELDTASVADELNAAAYAGDITMTVTAANINGLTFGAGDDTITVVTAETATLVGGGGNDTLVAGADMDGFTFSGFEVLDASANITNMDSSQLATALLITGGTVTVDNADTTTVDFSIHTVDTNVLFTFDGTLDTTVFASTQGLTITGNSNADVLTGTANADTISGGNGADDITGAAGADTITAGEGADEVLAAGGDTIDLTETTSAADNVVFAAITSGSAAGVAAGSFTGFNVITGFATTVDDLVFDSGLAFNQDTVNTAVIGNAAGDSQVVAATAAVTASNDLTMANYTDVDAVVAFMNDGGYTDSNAGTADVSSVAVTFTDFTAIYAINNNTTDAVIASEITLVATVDEVLVTGDIVIA